MPKKSNRPRPEAKPSKRAKPAPALDSREVRALRAKLASMLGEAISRQQQRDLIWFEKESRDRIVANYFAAVPKGEYCELAGRQHKVIDDAARLYDLPIDGPTVNLYDAIRSLHDFIAANAPKLRSVNIEGDKAELEDEKLRQQISKLTIENDRLMILLKRDKGEAIDRAQLAAALSEVIAAVREYGRAFERISPNARKLFNDMLEFIAIEIESGRLRF